MNKTTVLVIGASWLLATAMAFADEPPPAVIVTDGMTPKVLGWSDQIISNGLVMPKADVGLYGELDVVTSTTTATPVPPQTVGAKITNTAFGPLIGAGYGIDDQLTIGGEYFVPVADANGAFPNAGVLTAYGGYSVARDDKMLVVLGGDLSLDFAGGTTASLHLGATFRYKVAPAFVVYSGNPLPAGPFGQQLVIGLNHSAPVALDLPVGAGYQASPKLFAFVQTTLAHIKLANTANAFIFADVIPLELGALYRATKDVDVGGFIDFPDLENVGQFFSIGVMARYYMHHK